MRGFSEKDWPNGAGSVGEKCCGRLFSPPRSRSKQALKEFSATNLKFTKLSLYQITVLLSNCDTAKNYETFKYYLRVPFRPGKICLIPSSVQGWDSTVS